MINQSFHENTKLKNPIVEDIFNCQLKDETGLNDFQKIPTKELIGIPKVGINRFRLPVNIENRQGVIRSHDATASMYVDLNNKKNGVSMSRLCSILQANAENNLVNASFFKNMLASYRSELRDETDLNLVNTAFLKLQFNYGIKQRSLKSENWGWQYYPVTLQAIESENEGFKFFISVDYEYSSTCPCSLSMAKQYEQEYRDGKTVEGSGIGVPHSQRSKLTCKVQLEPGKNIFIEDIIDLIRLAIPTETQSLVKRLDEQAFAILNGANPMFVEHASKKMYTILNTQEDIIDWIVSFEHYESLHSHNAAAVIYKGIENGLRSDPIF